MAIDRGARVGGGEAAADAGCHGIDRQVVDGFAESVGAVHQQAGFVITFAEGELGGVVVGIRAIVDDEDLAELLVGAEVSGQGGLFDAAGEVAGGVLAEVRGGGAGIGEGGVDDTLLDDGHGERAGAGGSTGERAIGAAAATEGNVLLHGEEGREDGFGIDLIGVPRAVEAGAAVSDVAGGNDVAAAELTLHGEVPHVHGGQLQIRVEDAGGGSVRRVLGGRREEGGRLHGGREHFREEARAEPHVRDGLAAGSGDERAVGPRERRRAGEGLARDGGGDGGDLKAVNGVEGHAVAGADDKVRCVAGRPGDAEARGDGAPVEVLVPAIGMDEGDGTLAAVDGLIGNVGAAAGFGGGRVHFPADAVADGEVATKFELILREEVVLAGALSLRPERYAFVAGAEGEEGVVRDVAEEDLGESGGDSEKVIDCALKTCEICSGDARDSG